MAAAAAATADLPVDRDTGGEPSEKPEDTTQEPPAKRQRGSSKSDSSKDTKLVNRILAITNWDFFSQVRGDIVCGTWRRDAAGGQHGSTFQTWVGSVLYGRDSETVLRAIVPPSCEARYPKERQIRILVKLLLVYYFTRLRRSTQKHGELLSWEDSCKHMTPHMIRVTRSGKKTTPAVVLQEQPGYDEFLQDCNRAREWLRQEELAVAKGARRARGDDRASMYDADETLHTFALSSDPVGLMWERGNSSALYSGQFTEDRCKDHLSGRVVAMHVQWIPPKPKSNQTERDPLDSGSEEEEDAATTRGGWRLLLWLQRGGGYENEGIPIPFPTEEALRTELPRLARLATTAGLGTSELKMNDSKKLATAGQRSSSMLVHSTEGAEGLAKLAQRIAVAVAIHQGRISLQELAEQLETEQASRACVENEEDITEGITEGTLRKIVESAGPRGRLQPYLDLSFRGKAPKCVALPVAGGDVINFAIGQGGRQGRGVTADGVPVHEVLMNRIGTSVVIKREGGEAEVDLSHGRLHAGCASQLAESLLPLRALLALKGVPNNLPDRLRRTLLVARNSNLEQHVLLDESWP